MPIIDLRDTDAARSAHPAGGARTVVPRRRPGVSSRAVGRRRPGRSSPARARRRLGAPRRARPGRLWPHGGPPAPPSRFRADIEGMRGVAVAAVCAFHATLPHATGGFVGVDVFFVISGFLVTTLLVREVELTGTVSLAAFCARRARRILPVAALVLALTTVAAWLLLPPLAAGDVARDALAATFHVGNLHFMSQQVDYFAAGHDVSPLLHYWSLGVGGQFSLVWAPLVLTLCVLARRRVRPAFLFTAVALSAASFWLAREWTAHDPAWAYLASPARAWQFGVGAVLALAAPAVARAAVVRGGRAASWVLGWTGLGLIGWSVVTLSEATPYPGTAALVPTLGAGALIAAGTGAATRGGPGRSSATRLLSARPVRAVGRVSFGWYLWHWPLLVVGQAVLGPDVVGRGGWPLKALLVGLAVPLAVLTYRFVERPLQTNRSVVTRPRGGLALGAAATAGSLVVVLGAGSISLATAGARPLDVRTVDVFGERLVTGAVTPSPLEARTDRPDFPQRCLLEPAQVRQPRCRIGTTTASGRPVMLFGDSHAAQWYPLAELLGRRLRAPVEVLTKSGCPVAPVSARSPQSGGDYQECYEWRAAMVERIREARPRLTIVASAGGYAGGVTPLSAWRPLMSALHGTGAPVVYVDPTPAPGLDVPACMSEHLRNWPACSFPRGGAGTADPVVAAARGGDLRGVHAVSAWPVLCPGLRCPAARGGVLLYRDGSHLTDTAASILAPVLLAQLAERRVVPGLG